MRIRPRLAAALAVIALAAPAALALRAAGDRSPAGPAPAISATRPAARSDSSGVAAPAALATPAPAPRFVVGAQRVYEVSSLHEGALVGASGEGAPMGIALRGDWTLTVLEVAAERVMVRAVVDAADVSISAADDRGLDARRDALRRQLAVPHVIELDPRGAVRALHLRPGDEPMAAGMAQTLATAAQVVVPAGAGRAWEAAEGDSTGAYVASYQRAGAAALEKRKLRYVSLTIGAAPAAAQVQSRTRITLDAASWPARLALEERVYVPASAALPGILLVGSLELRLRDARTVAPGDVSLAGLERVPVGGMLETDRRKLARDADRNTLRGATYNDLLAALAPALRDEGTSARGEVMLRLAALLRLDPAAARSIAGTILAGTEGREGTAVLLGALGDADTAEAEQALVSIAEHRAAPADLRADAITHLALAPRPGSATVEALARLLDGDAGEVRDTAALALGSAARTLSGDAGRGAAIAEDLLARAGRAASAEERTLCLRALGNAGDPRALGAIQAALGEGAPRLRAAAVEALRFLPDPAADALLAAHLGRDADVAVRRSAAFAARFRALDAVLPALAAALERDADESVRAEVAGVLGDCLEEAGEAVRPLLDRSAAADPSADVRAAAAAALGR